MLNQKSLVSGSLWDGSLQRHVDGKDCTQSKKHAAAIQNAEGGWPVEQLLIRQEVIDPRDVDQSEAEHRNVGVGCEDPGDACREGHRQVARDLHQTAGERRKHTNGIKTNPVNSLILLTSIQQISIIDVIKGDRNKVKQDTINQLLWFWPFFPFFPPEVPHLYGRTTLNHWTTPITPI